MNPLCSKLGLPSLFLRTHQEPENIVSLERKNIRGICVTAPWVPQPFLQECVAPLVSGYNGLSNALLKGMCGLASSTSK